MHGYKWPINSARTRTGDPPAVEPIKAPSSSSNDGGGDAVDTADEAITAVAVEDDPGVAAMEPATEAGAGAVDEERQAAHDATKAKLEQRAEERRQRKKAAATAAAEAEAEAEP